MKSITQHMKFKQSLMECSRKHGVSKARGYGADCGN